MKQKKMGMQNKFDHGIQLNATETWCQPRTFAAAVSRCAHTSSKLEVASTVTNKGGANAGQAPGRFPRRSCHDLVGLKQCNIINETT